MDMEIYCWMFKTTIRPSGEYVTSLVNWINHEDGDVSNDYNKTVMNLLLAGF